ncbi:MAG: serine/threonine-protein kinase, partial [Acidobacteriota bacterium]
MTLAAGQKLAHYSLLEKIGEGGMGVVWKALDTQLDREVAVKFLPPAFATDSERLARFEREAKMLAALNHPHIAAVYGLHQHQGQRFLAMELVPGEDLAVRLGRGPMPVEKALALTLQVSATLEAAHAQGVVHRDLKPANIRLTSDGSVKVLDFGLAKALDERSSSGSLSPSLSPTLTAGTAAGVILGTAAYMSPEQARGQPADRRADIWSLGVVLYEM